MPLYWVLVLVERFQAFLMHKAANPNIQVYMQLRQVSQLSCLVKNQGLIKFKGISAGFIQKHDTMAYDGIVRRNVR